MDAIEIGYYCPRGSGHVEFYAEADYDGQCGSKRTAGIYVILDEFDDEGNRIDFGTIADDRGKRAMAIAVVEGIKNRLRDEG